MGFIGFGRYILWIDQAEFYVVCASCYDKHKHDQWSGHTVVCRQGDRECWERYKRTVYEQAADTEKCVFCGRGFPPYPEDKRWWRRN